MTPSWPSAVVAVALIALVGVMFWRAVDADFATIWAGVGTLVGVLTGAVPSYFFHQDAAKARDRAEAIAANADPAAIAAARASAPKAFE
jgi:hypothetical protein